MPIVERGPRSSSAKVRIGGGRNKRSDYVFIDASQVGPRTITSVRLSVSKGFRAGLTGRARNRGKKVVVYNFGKKGEESFWLGKLKAKKSRFRRILEKICAGLPNQAMIDYCHNNIKLFEGDRPSIEQLSRGFGDMADHGGLRLGKSEFMAGSDATLDFKKSASKGGKKAAAGQDRILGAINGIIAKGDDFERRHRDQFDRLKAK